MGGKLHRFDGYDLKKHINDNVGTFLDIGACIGSVSIMARILFPETRIIALEPCIDNFEILTKQAIDFEYYNIALGPGAKMCYWHKRARGMRKFVSKDEMEREKYPILESNKYFVGSKTLPQIFNDYNINTDEDYIIKCDCEGGERFIYNDVTADKWIRGAIMFIVEVHMFWGVTAEEWDKWFNKFRDTHEVLLGIKHKYCTCSEVPKNRKRFTIQLLRKKCNG